MPERALRGKGLRKMEGTSGRLSACSFTRAGRWRPWRLSRSSCTRERHGHRGRGDRGVRGKACTHRDGKTTLTAVKIEPRSGKSVQPAEANRTAVQHAISSTALARKRLTHRKPTMRGYWYEEVRWQKSVQRIARGDVRRAARQVGGVTLAKEHSALRTDVRGGGFEVRTVRGSRDAF